MSVSARMCNNRIGPQRRTQPRTSETALHSMVAAPRRRLAGFSTSLPAASLRNSSTRAVRTFFVDVGEFISLLIAARKTCKREFSAEREGGQLRKQPTLSRTGSEQRKDHALQDVHFRKGVDSFIHAFRRPSRRQRPWRAYGRSARAPPASPCSLHRLSLDDNFDLTDVPAT